MKWLIAALVVLGIAVLLLFIAPPAPSWSVSRDSTGAIRLTLAADAPVRGWTRSALPVLVVRCDRGVSGIVLLAGLPFEVEKKDTRSVSVQFDDEPATIGQWTISQDRQVATAAAKDARMLLPPLLAADRLTLAFVPLRSEPVEARFSVRGLRAIWQEESVACG